MNEQDLIGRTARIVGIDTGGGAGQSDFVSHITLDTVDGPRVFVQATDPAHTWEIKTDRCYGGVAAVQRDPLHDALVAVFEAIAEREEKTVGQVVEELFSGYLEGGA